MLSFLLLEESLPLGLATFSLHRFQLKELLPSPVETPLHYGFGRGIFTFTLKDSSNSRISFWVTSVHPFTSQISFGVTLVHPFTSRISFGVTLVHPFTSRIIFEGHVGALLYFTDLTNSHGYVIFRG